MCDVLRCYPPGQARIWTLAGRGWSLHTVATTSFRVRSSKATGRSARAGCDFNGHRNCSRIGPIMIA
jgi:hypothetical protein